jgi:hypothetical protein
LVAIAIETIGAVLREDRLEAASALVALFALGLLCGAPRKPRKWNIGAATTTKPA